MQKNKRINLIIINIACILALIVVIFPLLMIAQYNYPTADDWSYGVNGYRAIQNGGGLFVVIGEAFKTAWNNYFTWEGRFVNAFLAALQPGIWGEQYYASVAWIMLGAIVFSEMFFFKYILCGESKMQNKWLWIPIIVPAIILQILYCPFPEESFYWYTGSVNYTFIYGLSLVLIVLFWKLGNGSYKKWKFVLLALSAFVLAVLVGGDNFATSLSCFLTMGTLSVIFAIYNRKALLRTWYITFVVGLSLFLCIFAPGNRNRVNSNFGGETGGVIEAIVMSLFRSFLNIYSWTNIKMILLILFILPFVWKCVKNIDFSFKLPGIFTGLTFGLYASQITATMYVDGTTGGGRMAAILYYSYYIWIICNFIYWVGWLNKKQRRMQNLFEINFVLYCAIVGVIIVGVLYLCDLRTLTSYRAYRNWRQGFAQQYAAEWDERLEILHDDSIKEVEFQHLSIYPDMLIYTDLQDETGHVWVNEACAQYYDKDLVKVVIP